MALGCHDNVFLNGRELQEMVNSLQKNIQQLKGEVSRYKSRAYKAEEKVNKVCLDHTH